ncbi:hypothetical protein MMC17_002081 [Xylographa soralifera]|nr:hypothetical protein [Xylographa soralifera]
MDVFAHYYHHSGLPGVSINAGVVSDSEHTIDGTSMDKYLDRFSHMASVITTLDRIHVGLIVAMHGSTVDRKPVSFQIVFGISDELRQTGPVVDQDGISSNPEDIRPIVKDLMGAATSLQEATHIVKQFIAPGMGVQPPDVDDEKPMYDMRVASFFPNMTDACSTLNAAAHNIQTLEWYLSMGL